MKSQLLSLAAVAILLPACGAGVRPTAPTVPNSVIKRVEERKMPPHPDTAPLPDKLPKGDWVVPQEKGSCIKADGTVVEQGVLCPKLSGLTISEARAYRDAMYRIRYKEMRIFYTSDRMVWAAHRELYEERLKLADQAIQELQPGWWTRNKFQLGVVGGVLVGIATSVAILTVTDRK